jgi:ferredoxin
VYDDAMRQTVPCDTVLLSVGQSPNLAFIEDGGKDIEQMRPGWPKVDKNTLMTSASGVFVAGDLAHGTRLLIDAVASGKSAARSVYRHLTGRTITLEQTTSHITLPLYKRERGYEAIHRVPVPTLEPEERLDHPDKLVELGYDCASAMREASRCLDCGVTPVFDGERCVLCGGCVDVCPTQCLKLVSLSDLAATESLDAAINAALGMNADRDTNSAILKDEDRCIRCALCMWRCPVDAITMERVCFTTQWRLQ